MPARSGLGRWRTTDNGTFGFAQLRADRRSTMHVASSCFAVDEAVGRRLPGHSLLANRECRGSLAGSAGGCNTSAAPRSTLHCSRHMNRRTLLRAQLAQAWKECIDFDYRRQRINSERSLQASFWEKLNSCLPAETRRLFIEPTMKISVQSQNGCEKVHITKFLESSLTRWRIGTRAGGRTI